MLTRLEIRIFAPVRSVKRRGGPRSGQAVSTRFRSCPRSTAYAVTYCRMVCGPTGGESMTPTRRGRSHKGSWPSCSHPSGSGQHRSGHCAAAPIREPRVDIINISSRMPGDVIAHRKMTRRHIPAMSKACAADKAKRDQHDLCVGNRKAHPRRPCARRADRPRCGRLANRQAPLRRGARACANAGHLRSFSVLSCIGQFLDGFADDLNKELISLAL